MARWEEDTILRRTLAVLAVPLCALTSAVTIEGNSVTPNGERIGVATGQDVQLDVTADAPGEIHVHSTPEQELEYDEGTTTLTIKGMERPGTVDVELHELEKIIVQLEVS